MGYARKKWWILFVTTSATSLIFLDNTVLPVALPTIQKHLGFHELGLVWVVNAYLLSLSALLLVGGRLSDLFGKRTLFVWGLTFFGLGSLVAAFSYYPWLLLVGRVLQGIGGSCAIPSTGALLIATFPEGERARAIGINTGISSVFLMLGPAVGGFLTQYVSWRIIFFLNIPLVIFGIIMSYLILTPERRKNETFHFTGAFAMLFAVVALVVGLMQANEWGWSSPWTLLLLVASPFLFALFAWISTHVKHPIIDFHLFRNSHFTAANIVLFITQSIVTVTIIWAIYFQDELHYSAVKTGLLIFFASFPVFFMAPLGGFLADRYGHRIPMLLGFALLIFSLSWLLFAVSKNILILLPGLLGFGCALPLLLSPTFALALTHVDPEKLGAASGITTETRQLASTTGIAIVTAIYHGTVKTTGSDAKGFSAITLFAALLAIIGFIIVFLMVKKKRHRQISVH